MSLRNCMRSGALSSVCSTGPFLKVVRNHWPARPTSFEPLLLKGPLGPTGREPLGPWDPWGPWVHGPLGPWEPWGPGGRATGGNHDLLLKTIHCLVFAAQPFLHLMLPPRNLESTSLEYLLQGRTSFNRATCNCFCICMAHSTRHYFALHPPFGGKLGCLDQEFLDTSIAVSIVFFVEGEKEAVGVCNKGCLEVV